MDIVSAARSMLKYICGIVLAPIQRLCQKLLQFTKLPTLSYFLEAKREDESLKRLSQTDENEAYIFPEEIKGVVLAPIQRLCQKLLQFTKLPTLSYFLEEKREDESLKHLSQTNENEAYIFPEEINDIESFKFTIKVSDCTGLWPVYAYTVRNMHQICAQYLEYASSNPSLSSNVDLIKRIQNIAHTGEYADNQNKVVFQIVCTKLVQKQFVLDEVITNRFDTLCPMPYDCFVPVLIVASHCEMQELLIQLDAVRKSHKPYLVVFLNNNDDEIDIPDHLSKNILWTSATLKEIFRKVDTHIMERLVLNSAEPMVNSLKEFLTDREFSSPEEQTSKDAIIAKQLLSQLKAVYERSDVPEDQRPVFPIIENWTRKEQLVPELLCIQNVLGCGEFFGTVEIDVQDDIEEEESVYTVKMIKETMKRFAHSDFRLRYISKDLKHYASTGAKIGQVSAMGTLGAFAKAETKKDSRSELSLVALMARHVAIFQPEKKLFFDGKYIADILDPSTIRGADIAVAIILDQYRSKCKQIFRTQEGKEVPCYLLADLKDLKQSKGDIVHIWGGTSKPGLGRIICCDYGVGVSSEERETGLHIIITDRHKQKFAEKGDSGSIVCKTSKTGDEVYAIGMLMGELVSSNSKSEADKISERRYSAMEIRYGIETLEKTYGLRIQWF